jgi:hypothetical protein
MKEYFEKIKNVLNGAIPQPDEITCQSTCIHEAIGRSLSIYDIRRELEKNGNPGDPYNMGNLIKKYSKNQYIFDDNASLSEMREWLKNGEFLITHGWFSNSGHVISLDGVAIDEKSLSYKLSVKDPYGEFNARSWRYDLPEHSYDGYYSSYLIYSTCVKGQSRNDAQYIYGLGELDSNLKGAWVHRVLP